MQKGMIALWLVAIGTAAKITKIDFSAIKDRKGRTWGPLGSRFQR